MAVSPSFYSSSRARWSHDVFLSFRGEDTRYNFTDHLYTALIEAEIHTFRDDEELCRGKEISSELLKAIQESKISIVVFSKGYASSRWCLDELVKIIDCKNSIGQIILPIFYNVNPSDVRKQSGSLAQAFEKHEHIFKGDMEKVNKWRRALTEAANLSGWDLQNVANGHKSKFIRKIVDDVLSKLNRNYLDVAKNPVGVDSRTKDVIDLLSIVSTNDVRIVGIHGMGGIGKTTIAKAVFNQLCDGFEGSCFLSNVKEISEQPNGLIQLQEQILRDVLKPKSFKIGNADRGINLIKERLCCKRVLLVFDDLDQMKQFNVLVGERNWFGLGSRIIITSRDEHLLTQLEVDSKYQVEELNRNDSLQLFSWHAFKESNPISEYVELSNGVVDYVGGLPLALEVLGSYLCKRSIPEWTSAVEKLRKIPHHQIQKKLRISFDTLDDDKVKDIFLDIACFFIGMDKDYVMKILDGCSFFPEIGMKVLIQRSLITIDSVNKLRMHDLLRDMGREIIREISPNRPGKRNRLWFKDDVLNILNKQEETEAVEGLVLDVQASNNVFYSTRSFAKMRYLRLLQINGVHLTGGYQHIFTELRWLCWHKCPLKFLPSNLQLDNLVVLDMQYSKIKEVWKEIKVLNKLQILNLSHCVYLTKTPNFLRLNSLERLQLVGCKSLVEVHQSIGNLDRFVFLNLEGCKALKNLPESICCLKTLITLNISYCSKLEKLPEKLGNMEALTEILADGTAIKFLPSSIGNLKNLKNLSLGGLRDDITPSMSWFSPKNSSSKVLLPLSGLSSLNRLALRNCNLSEDSIPNLGNLSLLQELDLGGNKFFSLPNGIGHLPKLHSLYLNSCTNLLSISELPSSLLALHAYNCVSMERLSIQSSVAPHLYLPNCQKLVEIQGLESVENAPFIHMEDCNNLANNFKQILVQVQSKFKLLAIFFPSSEVPNWFSYQEEGSSLSFYIPRVLHGEIKGIFIWAVYSACKYGSETTSSPFATIRNKSNGDEYIHRSTYLPTSLVRQDHSWVSCVPFSLLPFASKGGDELEMSVIGGIFTTVKKCGVHLILENEVDVMDDHMVASSSSSSYENFEENLDSSGCKERFQL